MSVLLLLLSSLNVFCGILGIYNQYQPMTIAINFAIALALALFLLEPKDRP